jgi:hypothetical protein
MRARGWRYSHTVRERATREHMFPIPTIPDWSARILSSAASPVRAVRIFEAGRRGGEHNA